MNIRNTLADIMPFSDHLTRERKFYPKEPSSCQRGLILVNCLFCQKLNMIKIPFELGYFLLNTSQSLSHIFTDNVTLTHSTIYQCANSYNVLFKQTS